MKFTVKLYSLILLSFIVLSSVIRPFGVNADAASKKLNLSAESASLVLCDSGKVIFSKNADIPLPMASTTKIMTAVVAIESCDVDKTVSVHADAVGTEGSSAYLTECESMTMKDLLYALMLQSANDAAVAIAYEIGGSIESFAELMNAKAEKLGLVSTQFANPHGLDSDEHYTTASELACLASYAMKNPLFREIVSTERYVTENGRVFVNHNKMLNLYEGAVGVKTGFTKRSGRCLVSAAERDGLLAVAVTLNAPDDWNDHKKMLDFCFESYETVTLAEIGQLSVDIPCVGGNKSTVHCSNLDSLRLTLPKGSEVSTTIEADRYYPAPVNAGDALATAKFYSSGELIAAIPLYAESDVKVNEGKLSLLDRILRLLGR